MKKHREKYPLHKHGDIVGVKVVVKDYSEVKNTVKSIKRRHKTVKRYEKNFYKNPKNGVYYAYHISIKGKHGRRMEVQIKTARQDKFHNKMHILYKRGITPRKRLRLQKTAIKLARRDGWGD